MLGILHPRFLHNFDDSEGIWYSFERNLPSVSPNLPKSTGTSQKLKHEENKDVKVCRAYPGTFPWFFRESRREAIRLVAKDSNMIDTAIQ